MNTGTRARHVVITGVSTGIGRATARALLRGGWIVWGSARRESDTADLAREGAGRFHPLIFDVTREDEIRAAAARVRESLAGAPLAALINNAGIAVGGPLATIPLAEVRRQFEVNVFGPVAVTQAFLPLLQASDVTGKGGRVINISSVSGKVAFPFFGPYSASKFALEALSDAFRREAPIRGVRVILVEPGAIRTEIWDKAEAEDITGYESTPEFPYMKKILARALKQGRSGINVARVAETIIKALNAPNPRPRYPVVKNYLTDWILPRIIPARLLDRVAAKVLGLK